MNGTNAADIRCRWELAHGPAGEMPKPEQWASLDWRETSVPSNVHTSAFGIPVERLYVRDRIRETDWMNDRYWLYRARFDSPRAGEDREAVFVLKGVDYRCTVYLDGKRVLDHEGMFSPIEVPLDERAASPGEERELVVVIHPFVKGAEPYETLKARYGFGDGWDFAPRLTSAGIWDDAHVVVRPKLRVASAYTAVKRANRQRADIVVHAEWSERIESGTVTVRIGGAARSFPIVASDRLAMPIAVPSPRWWWPNGRGEPHLVELQLELDVPGRRTEPFRQRIGLRTVERVPCEGQGQEDTPLRLRINGEELFLNGVNWVPADACPAEVTAERYRTFLQRFRDAGVNFVRVWGGGLKEKDAFYDIADELGLMVMQEFPLACQKLARSETFYRVLEQEASAIVRALRHHPSVVVWSGGNEHYHYWDAVDSGTDAMEAARPAVRDMFGIGEGDREWLAGADTYAEPALALLDSVCAGLDGTRPYQITSALEGEGEVHGIWNWNPRIGDHRYRDYESLYAFWRSADKQLYSEASVSSIANADTIRDVLGLGADEPLGGLPEKSDPMWRLHHAFGSVWDGHDDLWLDIPSTEKLFGPMNRLEELVFANQWMQGEGCRFLIEELRRRQRRVAGVVWWGVNEPWPGLAGNALLDYYGRPKLGWSFLASAFRPTVASLRYEHCVARAVKPELWVSRNGGGRFEGRYEAELVHLHTGETETIEGRVVCGDGESVYVRTLPRVRLVPGSRLHVRLRLFDEAGGALVHTNDYVFAPAEEEAPFRGETAALLKRLYASGPDGGR
ncbi:glycoside hydrolase family 2 protein [Paenibacillus flagellatus]|uniref:beta-mannosidase n=1 Tax=Paenibacillus flagellatus TaxID=2211139 RepID=A0A2V5KAQ3_9BACL|nr:glycoside hydrolase family 2 TIM barrel-domain containing protein [Paenibacillus flagellatus]PYI56538.1 hypothetical protein DLM86_06095 [Paenibacillus flagellatus]